MKKSCIKAGVKMMLFSGLASLFSLNVYATTLSSDCQLDSCKESFAQFELAAKRGHAQAMATLGQFYYHAYGTEKDVGAALKYLRKASRLGGDTGAQFKAGLIYLKEPGYKDIDEGIKYLNKAAKKKYKSANFVLGMVYMSPEFGKQDDKLADSYLAKAYQQKHPEMVRVAKALMSEGKPNIQDFPELAAAIEDEPLVKSASGELNWPQDEMEVITVTSPPLETVLREQLVTYRRPVKTTGTRFSGKRCAERVSCFASDGVEGAADYTFLHISYNRASSGSPSTF